MPLTVRTALSGGRYKASRRLASCTRFHVPNSPAHFLQPLSRWLCIFFLSSSLAASRAKSAHSSGLKCLIPFPPTFHFLPLPGRAGGRRFSITVHKGTQQVKKYRVRKKFRGQSWRTLPISVNGAQ